MCTNHAMDTAVADGFAERLLDMFNSGALSVMVSIGHRAGLFDAMSRMDHGTSSEIAAAAKLDERYVREWLGAMASGRIIEYDATTRAFRLPPEHAASLTRANPAANMAVFAQYLGVLGTVEDDVLECFRRGGGVPYERFGRFHEVMAEDSGQTVVAALFDTVLPLVPGLDERLAAGIDVLDIGCGRGRALLTLAAAFPTSRFVGYDLSAEAIEWARARAVESGLDNLRFEVRDVSGDLGTDRFDLITAFDAIHDQARPAEVLSAVRRALRPTGTFLMQDIAGSSELANNLEHPLAPFLYTVSTMHCMTVSLAYGGPGLGTMWGRETAERMLREAGFASVEVNQLEHDVQNLWYVVRPTSQEREAAA